MEPGRAFSRPAEALWILGLLGVWEASSRALAMPYFPPLSTVIERALLEASSGAVIPHVLATLTRILEALAVALAAGVAFGIAGSRRCPGGNPFRILVLSTYPMPHTPLLPLLLWFFDIELGKVALIALVAFYPIATSTMEWLSRVPRTYLEIVRSLGGGAIHVIIYSALPYTLPGILTGLRIASSTAYAVSYVAESVAESKGLGYLVNYYWHSLDYVGVYSALLVFSLLGASTYAAIMILERRALRWVYERQGPS